MRIGANRRCAREFDNSKIRNQQRSPGAVVCTKGAIVAAAGAAQSYTTVSKPFGIYVHFGTLYRLCSASNLSDTFFRHGRVSTCLRQQNKQWQPTSELQVGCWTN